MPTINNAGQPESLRDFFNADRYLNQLWSGVRRHFEAEMEFASEEAELLNNRLYTELKAVFMRYGMANPDPVSRLITSPFPGVRDPAPQLLELANNLELGRKCAVQQGPKAAELRRQAMFMWMLEKSYHVQHDLPGYTPEDVGLDEAGFAVNYYGCFFDHTQSLVDVVEELKRIGRASEFMEEQLCETIEEYTWTRPGGTEMAVYVRWTPGDDDARFNAEITEVVVKDFLEGLTYAGDHRNISVAEFTQAFEAKHKKPDLVNPEK